MGFGGFIGDVIGGAIRSVGSLWTPVRDAVESAAVLAGNYFIVPGSSLLTSGLTSKGSQDFLNSDIGKIAQIGSSVYGAMTPETFSQKIGMAGDWSNAKLGTSFAGSAAPEMSAAKQAVLSGTGNAPGIGNAGIVGNGSLTDAALNEGVQSVTGSPLAVGSKVTADATGAVAKKLGAIDKLGNAWDKVSTFISDNPGPAMMGASAIAGGMGATAQAQTAEEQLAYQRSLTDRAYTNINSPVSLNIRAAPYQPVGLIGGRV